MSYKFDPWALETLIHWITQRERVRTMREAGGLPPWTADPIIAEWRFCNVNRCDDRETKWIFQHVIAEHATSSVIWFNLAIARFINWSPTLAKLGYFDEWDAKRFVAVIEALQATKDKVFTGAYMIPAGPNGIAKHVYLAEQVFTRLWNLGVVVQGLKPQPKATCADWDVFLRKVPLMGDFLRNQIITDMKYSHHLTHAKDWSTFILAGPGTQRGLNRMLALPLNQKWGSGVSAEALVELRKVVLAAKPQWTETFKDLNNLSNCMCELDKYCRVLKGEGKPRARYKAV